MTEVAPLPRVVVQLFAKAPVAGRVKTRLIPALGAEAAAALAARMLANSLAVCHQAMAQSAAQYTLTAELWAAPNIDSADWLGVDVPAEMAVFSQCEGDLGARMATGVRYGLERSDGVILIGSDCPEISAASLHWAAQGLLSHDSVMIPSVDGGYALLGLRCYLPSLFSDMPWSTARVAGLTRQRLDNSAMRLLERPAVHDIDEAADLVHLPSAWTEYE